MLTEKDIERWSKSQSDTPAVVGCFMAGARWANDQNAAEIQDLSAQNKEIKNFLFRIQAQYEQAAKEAVVSAAEIERLEAEKAELLECLDAARTGFLLMDAPNTAKAIKEVLKQFGKI